MTQQEEEHELTASWLAPTVTAVLTVATTLGLAVLWWRSRWSKRDNVQQRQEQQRERHGLTLDAVPDEILFHVMSFLDQGRDLVSASAVCSRWALVGRDPGLWERMVRSEFAASPLWTEADGHRGALTSASLRRWNASHEFPECLRELVRRVCTRASKEGVIDWYALYAIEARSAVVLGQGQTRSSPTSAASSLWLWLKRTVMRPTTRLLFLGIDNVGKTTLIHILRSDRLVIHPPSAHPYQEEVVIAGQRVMLIDPAIAWRRHVRLTNFLSSVVGGGLVYLVDAADRERLEEARTDLARAMKHAEENRLPLLVLGNKIDRREALSERQLKTALGIHYHCTGKKLRPLKKGVQPVELFMASVVKRAGYSEGFRWLIFHLSQNS